MSALEISAKIKAGELKVVDAVRPCLDALKENRHNAFTPVKTGHEERVLKKAESLQKRIDAGEFVDSPLAGVPIGLKDNVSQINELVTGSSKMLTGYESVFNATIVDKIEQAGMLIVGKLNMDEFAMGSTNETSFYGAVTNPHNNDRVAGGSSGGSAAAVAAKEIPLAIGSDTGGSIRQPSAFCGVVGMKPTYGTVSRYGVLAFASSLDQVGAIASNVSDCSALLSVISGEDKLDSTCVTKKPFCLETIDESANLSGLKVGIPRNFLDVDVLDKEIKESVTAAIETFRTAGAIIEEFEMPLMEYIIPAYYIISCAEGSSNFSKYDGLKYGYRSEKAKTLNEVYRLSRSEGFGMEVKRRIMVGSFVLSSGYYDAYYKKALQARELIKNNYLKLFEKFDVILTPTTPITAYKLKSHQTESEIANVGIMKMYMGDIYTASVNLAGLPAISVPCGVDGEGLPIGLQIIGDSFADEKLLGIAKAYENIAGSVVKA